MRAFLTLLMLVLVAGCSTRVSEREVTAFFDGQKGRVLSAKQVEGFALMPVGENLIEYVPNALPKSGRAVVWCVDVTGLDQLNARATETLVGRIVSWRIIGDRSKVRIPISYSAG
jgi:hypothetical protein